MSYTTETLKFEDVSLIQSVLFAGPEPDKNPEPNPEKKPEVEPDALPTENPGEDPQTKPDDDDDDDDPFSEIEIGDDPDEIQKKTTIM